MNKIKRELIVRGCIPRYSDGRGSISARAEVELVTGIALRMAKQREVPMNVLLSRVDVCGF